MTWQNAFVDLTDALTNTALEDGDSIWVRGNTGTDYIPGGSSPTRADTFLVPNGVLLYGGFDGTESTLNDRAGLYTQTILSGEILTASVTDNCRHVVTIEGGAFETLVDGFKIQDGYATGTGTDETVGAGVLAVSGPTLRLENLTVADGYSTDGGTGVFFTGGSLEMVFCHLEDNVTSGQGGGLWFYDIEGDAYIYNTIFESNRACQGGGVFAQEPILGVKSIFANCLLFENFANFGGGAYLDSDARSEWRDCTFAFNTTSTNSLGNCSGGGLGGGIYDVGGAVATKVHNSILWQNTAPALDLITLCGLVTPCQYNVNIEFAPTGSQLAPTVTYSDLSGTLYPGTGNVNGDPAFIDPATGDFQIGSTSGALNNGLAAEVPIDYYDFNGNGNHADVLPKDLAFGPRFVGTVDMGAYERQ